MKIACLHTMASNIELFENAAPVDVELSHTVREDLLQRALAAGAADEGILDETAEALKALSGDAILLTCSTIGPAAQRAGAVRVDAALADAAAEAAASAKLDVLVTAPSTVGPTRDLFEASARKTGALVNIVMVEGAIELLQSGELDAYAKCIAEAADASTSEVVALAEASMTPAASFAKRKVLTSPEAGLQAAITAAGPV